MKQISIKAKNDRHYKAIQKQLFELGYEWFNTGTKLMDLVTTLPYIHTTKEGKMVRSSEERGESKEVVTLDDLFNVENPELIIGKWYKIEGYLKDGHEIPAVVCFTGKDKEETYGFGFNSSRFTTTFSQKNWVEGRLGNYEEAEPDEVRKLLLEEADKRGLVVGAKIKSVKGSGYLFEQDGIIRCESGKLRVEFSDGNTYLYADHNVAFFNGEWAELYKPIEIAGYQVKFYPGHIKIGCKSIANSTIDNLYTVGINKISINIDWEGRVINISRETLKEILDGQIN